MTSPRRLTEDQIKRLAFVQYLMQQADQQAANPHPLNSAALLSLQDAVELFLAVACESYGRSLGPRTQFDDYFKLLADGTSPQELPRRTEMGRLNKARVALKHHGIQPDVAVVNGFLPAARSFLMESSVQLWGFNFDELSLSVLIADDELRDLVQRCEKKIAEGTNCLGDVSIAFAMLLHKHAGRRDGQLWEPAMPYDEASLLDVDIPAGLKTYLLNVQSTLGRLQVAVTVLSLPIDYQRYQIFDMNSYPASRRADGTYQYQGIPIGANLEMARDGLQFVIDCAIKLQNRPSKR